MKLLDWTEVNLVIKTIIENKINFDILNGNDAYGIEKITDIIFDEVRKKQLEKSR